MQLKTCFALRGGMYDVGIREHSFNTQTIDLYKQNMNSKIEAKEVINPAKNLG